MPDEGEVHGGIRAVRDEFLDGDVHGAGDLAHDEQRGVAGAPLELGEVALRDPGGLRQHAPRHAAPRP